MKIEYTNLTDGLTRESIPDGARCIKVDSRTFEARRYADILRDLSDDFYMQLASGNDVAIIEHVYSDNAHLHRTEHIIAWVTFALDRAWFNRNSRYIVHNVENTAYFSLVYQNLPQVVARRLQFFRRFLNCQDISLSWVVIDHA